jgi:tRNA dimethylallyltransferase
VYIIISGSTATGKSNVAIELAKVINGEVVSADSMQVYKGMNIGTSKIPEDKMQAIPHHMLDVADPKDEYSVAKYKEQTEKIMDEIKSRGNVPVLTGGTGLYINALIRGLFSSKSPTPELKEKLRKLETEKGKEYLFEMLKEKDPEEASVIDKNNPRRIIRALEIIMTHDEKISELKKETKKTIYPDDYVFVVLNSKRETLYDKIDKRVDDMVESGLINEVKSLMTQGVDPGLTAMQAIGYKEIVDYFAGKVSEEDAIIEIKQNTRNYAKRQITWMKRYKEAVWMDVDGKGAKDIALEIKGIVVSG